MFVALGHLFSLNALFCECFETERRELDGKEKGNGPSEINCRQFWKKTITKKKYPLPSCLAQILLDIGWEGFLSLENLQILAQIGTEIFFMFLHLDKKNSFFSAFIDDSNSMMLLSLPHLFFCLL